MPVQGQFIRLDIAWGSQGQQKAKPVGLTFWHTSQLIRKEIYIMFKQFK